MPAGADARDVGPRDPVAALRVIEVPAAVRAEVLERLDTLPLAR